MIKYIFLLLVTQNLLFSAIWSLTMMDIPTSKIIPTVTNNMKIVISKQNSINSQYIKVLNQVNVNNQYIIKDSILDKQVLSELMKTNFILNQKTEIYSNNIFSNNLLLPVTKAVKAPATKEKNFTKTQNISLSGSYTFACACAGALSSAFNNIDTHLFSNNLNPLNNKLLDLKPIIEDSINQIKKNKTKLEKELARMKLMVLKTKKYIFKLHKETPLRANYNK